VVEHPRTTAPCWTRNVALDGILESHLIDPVLLRADDYDGFYAARKTALVDGIEAMMGKAALRDGIGRAEDYDEEQEVRRSQAMRQHRREPSARVRLKSGDLSLTSAAQLETAFAGAERQNRTIRNLAGCEEPAAATPATAARAERAGYQHEHASGCRLAGRRYSRTGTPA
jgi:hypothetical protein